MDKEIKYPVEQVNLDFWSFANEVEQIMSSGNLDKLVELIHEKNYLTLDNVTKERQLFYIAVNTINTFGPFDNGIKVLNYLIFDYNITEENSLNYIPAKLKKHVEPLFTTRSLNKELNHNSSTSKRIKV
jgi:hypothetical protein